MVKKILIHVAILAVAICASNTNILWPKPANFSITPDGQSVIVNPCYITYTVYSPGKAIIQEMINFYLTKVFNCPNVGNGPIQIKISVLNTNVMDPTEVKHERYELQMTKNNPWSLICEYYPGFLRGLETFFQLFEWQEDESWKINGLPISITDGPQYKWRALMIDTSRHFLPVSTIKRALDFMMFAKLNVLHWHITDEDSFPLYVPKIPELSQFGSINGIYSQADVKDIINYALSHGIRVVPEIDTPAHSQSWGRSQKYKEITLNCDGVYGGQLDPTLNLTWQVLGEVLGYVNKTFTDLYVHFGGDQVDYDCWGDRPGILEWMKEHGIADFKALSVDFRQRQKQLWRGISKKKVIYWANQQIDLPVQDDDVIQWWGVSDNVDNLIGRPNEVILSNYDLTYLDVGFGEVLGYDYQVYENWRKAYSFNPAIAGVNVIGGASCMWNQIGHTRTFDQKVMQRASVIGERLWNPNIDLKSELRNIATRLNAHSERLRRRGFKVWPVTVGICENQMDICFR